MKIMTKKEKDKVDLMEQWALSTNIALLFKKVVENKDLIDFTLHFLKSDIYKQYFTNHTIFSQSPLYVLQLFKEELFENNKDYDSLIKKEEMYEEDIALWFVYMLSEWQQDVKIDVASLTYEDLDWLYVNYDVLHTQDVKYVFDVFMEERRGQKPHYQTVEDRESE